MDAAPALRKAQAGRGTGLSGKGLSEAVVLVMQLVSRHSCVADRLPVVVRRKATGSDKKKERG